MTLNLTDKISTSLSELSEVSNSPLSSKSSSTHLQDLDYQHSQNTSLKPRLVQAKSDAEVSTVRPVMGQENVTLLTEAKVLRLHTSYSGRNALRVGDYLIERMTHILHQSQQTASVSNHYLTAKDDCISSLSPLKWT